MLTTFVLIHETPNVWFQTRADALDNQSNPVSVLLELGLMGLAIARVIGSIDHLIVTIRAELMAFVFVGVAIATSFWSADPAETMEKAIVFTAVSLYGAYLVLRFSLHQILKLFGIMFAFSAVLNLAFVFGLPIYGVGGFDEFTGVFAQKNALGFFAAIALPALIVAAKTTPRWRILFLGTAVLELVLLIGSQSKTMLLAGVGPTLLLAAYHLFRSRRTLRGAVILSMAGTTVFTVLFATANIGLLAEWLDKDVTLTGRVPLWESLFPVIQERLVFGHGYRATFAGYHSPVHDILIQNPWNPTHAHNAALQILMEMGLLGLIPFLISYVRGLSRSIQLAAIVPGAVGLWPLSFLTTTLMVVDHRVGHVGQQCRLADVRRGHPVGLAAPQAPERARAVERPAGRHPGQRRQPARSLSWPGRSAQGASGTHWGRSGSGSGERVSRPAPCQPLKSSR